MMIMSSPSQRQNSFKQAAQGRGATVSQQRTNRRKHLLEHFKSLRIKVIDNFRAVSEDDLDYESLLEIKKMLADVDEKGLVSVEELNQIKLQVEEELKFLQAEQYLKEDNEEINSIADYLMEKCLLCGTLLNENNICGKCYETHFDSNKF